MASYSIGWGDGSTDKITVEYLGTVGVSNMPIVSDPNSTPVQRQKTIPLKASDGTVLATVSITQEARARAYSAAYNNGYL